MAKLKILVVDDSPMLAEAVKAKLETNNYEVSLAFSGEEALDQIFKDPPDLLVLDAYMPGIDGFEVCRRLRARTETSRLPIVMLSSKGDTREKLAGFRAGADDYLVKDLDLLDLPYRIKTVFKFRGVDLNLDSSL